MSGVALIERRLIRSCDEQECVIYLMAQKRKANRRRGLGSRAPSALSTFLLVVTSDQAHRVALHTLRTEDDDMHWSDLLLGVVSGRG